MLLGHPFVLSAASPGKTSAVHPLVRHLRALAASAIVLFGLWALIVGVWDRSIVLFGVVAVLIASALAELLRARAGVGVRIPAALLAKGLMIPPMIVADFGVLLWALARSGLERHVVRGELVTRPLRVEGAGARAWIALAASYSPNALVIDVDPENETVLLHDLVPWRRSEEPA
jgi:multisubunit Na+/H+ antiporter MnhE subunit